MSSHGLPGGSQTRAIHVVDEASRLHIADVVKEKHSPFDSQGIHPLPHLPAQATRGTRLPVHERESTRQPNCSRHENYSQFCSYSEGADATASRMLHRGIRVLLA